MDDRGAAQQRVWPARWLAFARRGRSTRTFGELTTISRGGLVMKRTLVMLTSLLALVGASLALAGPKEDVGAATQAWIDGMNSHNAERVVALYDGEAVLWGTRSSTLRDTPTTVRDYFKVLQTVPSSYKV